VKTIEPGSDAFAELSRQVPEGQPIVLINLLRFRARVVAQGEELSGRRLYERYAKALEPLVMAVGGRPIWRAQGRFVLIGPGGEHWDEVILVAYPSRNAFERLVNSPGFRECTGLRTAALEDSRLIVATAPQHISWLAWSLHKLAATSRRRGAGGMAWLREAAHRRGGQRAGHGQLAELPGAAARAAGSQASSRTGRAG
jgi:uncharacterized protein (DUF1330 family)